MLEPIFYKAGTMRPIFINAAEKMLAISPSWTTAIMEGLERLYIYNTPTLNTSAIKNIPYS